MVLVFFKIFSNVLESQEDEATAKTEAWGDDDFDLEEDDVQLQMILLFIHKVL